MPLNQSEQKEGKAVKRRQQLDQDAEHTYTLHDGHVHIDAFCRLLTECFFGDGVVHPAEPRDSMKQTLDKSHLPGFACAPSGFIKDS